MNILVTGGAGFIGSNFIDRILATSSDSVCCFDAMTYAATQQSIDRFADNKNYSFIHGDICDRSAVKSALVGIDVIVHFAAETHVDRSILGPDVFVSTNCLGTNVLCDAAREVGIERMIHISTDEVYGSIEIGSFSESDALDPRSPYSAAKAGSDLIARSYFETHDLPVIVTRSSNQYGPFQFPEKLIPLFVTQLMSGKPIPLYGAGDNVRDWLHVSDNCAAIDLVMRHGDIGSIYNIGAGNERTNLEVTRLLLDAFGRDDSHIEYVDDRLGHDKRYSITCDPIHQLGWVPEMVFEDGISHTIEWYLDNEAWWQPLRQRVKNR